MSILENIKKELHKHNNPKKAILMPQFFKAFPGGYGDDGDRFLGISVPNQRLVARMFYKSVSLKELGSLLCNPIHEYRLTALIILVYKLEKTENEQERKNIFDFYLKNISFVNNWDLVDASADKILGAYLYDKDRKILYKLAKSSNLWENRIAMVACFYFIKKNDFEDGLKIAELLIDHKHDLIHKAVGWMLREIGKRNFEVEFNFLKKYYLSMPRTMLRYAIEKFDQDLRIKFLKGENILLTNDYMLRSINQKK